MGENAEYATEEERWQALRIEGREAAAPDDYEPEEEPEVTEDGEQ